MSILALAACTVAIAQEKAVLMTASVFGPGVDRHSSRFDRIAYRRPGVRGDSRLHHIPRMSVACNRFPLGVWLKLQRWDRKKKRGVGPVVNAFNGDRCGTPSRVDLLVDVWDALTGKKRPFGLIPCVKIWRMEKENER